MDDYLSKHSLFLSSLLSNIVERSICYVYDIKKTRVQLLNYNYNNNNTYNKYNNTYNITDQTLKIRNILKSYNYGSIYYISPIIILTIQKHLYQTKIQDYCIDATSHNFYNVPSNVEYSWWKQLGTFGFIQGSINGIILSPFELLKTRKQISALSNININNMNMLYIFRGMIPSILYSSMVGSTYILLVDYIRRYLFYKNEDFSGVKKYISSLSSGIISSLLFLPIDVVRTRMQADTTTPMRSIIKEMIKQKHFYSGGFSMLRLVIYGTSINMFTYDYFLRYFKNRKPLGYD